MKLDELKEWHKYFDSKGYTSNTPLMRLAPEIIALVEAANRAGGDNASQVSDAIDAFNAKLSSL